MNFDDYCRQKAAPIGSSIYYALRYAPMAKRALLTALYAYRCELAEAVRETPEITLGRTKLAWWRNETARLCAVQSNHLPNHPVLRAIVAHSGGDATAFNSAFGALLNGFSSDLEQDHYPDFASLQCYLEQVGGRFAALIARLSARDTAGVDQWAVPLGTALALTELVCEVGNHARYGRIYLPIDEMQRFSVSAADLLKRRYSDAFIALMRFQTQRARQALDCALQAISLIERRRQLVLRAQAALARALLDEIEKDNYSILHQRIALTPLRKLWIAWRTAHTR